MLKLALMGLAGIAALEFGACRQPARTSGETAPSKPAPPPPPPPFTAKDVSAALETLTHAPDHGFPAKRFDAEGIRQRLGSTVASEQEEGRKRLRAAVLSYARAQHGLTIPTGALPRLWNQRPSKYDADGELNAALRAGTLQSWLDALPPQTPAYRALQATYLAARDEAPSHPRPSITAGPLEIGQADARSEALRKRLLPDDPALADADPDARVDDDLIDALRAYQGRHGLAKTGDLDSATLALLNAPSVNKTAKLRLNMERLRWLPRPEPLRRIDVNIASAEMDYVKDGQPVAHMLAVSGKIGDETPIVSSAIDSIVLNPPWYVPTDIAKREIIPKGAAYMQSRHFVWRGGRIIQQPGPKTALGLVKFDFPNPYAVYLHDTPSKASFSLTQRTASHGCIRLQHAVELAKLVAAEEPGMSAERVDKILASGKTVRLKLATPVPVRLMYLTAEVKDGEVVFLPDVYGWDGVLLALLDRYQAPRRKS